MIFSLIPFTAQDSPDLTIQGKVHRQKNIFSVHYVVTGNLREIYIPFLIGNPTRKDDLWRTTCFELFIAVKDSPRYWEFNLSPSGEWNVYVMDAYRQVNMRQETRINWLQFEGRNNSDCFSLEIELDLSPIITENAPIEAGITSVIQTKDGKESYWALNHPHPEADFHLRNSFVLEFPFPP